MALGPMPNRLRLRTSILAVTTRGQPSGLNLAWTRWLEGEAAAVEKVRRAVAGGCGWRPRQEAVWLTEHVHVAVQEERWRVCGWCSPIDFVDERSEGVEHVMALEMESPHVLVSFDLAECRSAEDQKKWLMSNLFFFCRFFLERG